MLMLRTSSVDDADRKSPIDRVRLTALVVGAHRPWFSDCGEKILSASADTRAWADGGPGAAARGSRRAGDGVSMASTKETPPIVRPGLEKLG